MELFRDALHVGQPPLHDAFGCGLPNSEGAAFGLQPKADIGRLPTEIGAMRFGHCALVDEKRYLPFPFEPRSWDGHPMQNRRGSQSFGCGSSFQDYVMIDPATGVLAPRAWKSMDHF